jgi:hypothetical protein
MALSLKLDLTTILVGGGILAAGYAYTQNIAPFDEGGVVRTAIDDFLKINKDSTDTSTEDTSTDASDDDNPVATDTDTKKNVIVANDGPVPKSNWHGRRDGRGGGNQPIVVGDPDLTGSGMAGNAGNFFTFNVFDANGDVVPVKVPASTTKPGCVVNCQNLCYSTYANDSVRKAACYDGCNQGCDQLFGGIQSSYTKNLAMQIKAPSKTGRSPLDKIEFKGVETSRGGLDIRTITTAGMRLRPELSTRNKIFYRTPSGCY